MAPPMVWRRRRTRTAVVAADLIARIRVVVHISLRLALSCMANDGCTGILPCKCLTRDFFALTA